MTEQLTAATPPDPDTASAGRKLPRALTPFTTPPIASSRSPWC